MTTKYKRNLYLHLLAKTGNSCFKIGCSIAVLMILCKGERSPICKGFKKLDFLEKKDFTFGNIVVQNLWHYNYENKIMR